MAISVYTREPLPDKGFANFGCQKKFFGKFMSGNYLLWTVIELKIRTIRARTTQLKRHNRITKDLLLNRKIAVTDTHLYGEEKNSDP